MNDNKFCPLIGGECKEDKCAFWYDDEVCYYGCAIAVLPIMFSDDTETINSNIITQNKQMKRTNEILCAIGNEIN